MQIFQFLFNRKPKKLIGFCFVVSLFALQFYSCAPSKCVLCEVDNSTIYKVELDDHVQSPSGQTIVHTYFMPSPVEVGKGQVNLYIVDCNNDEKPFLLSGNELEQYIKKNIFSVDQSKVKAIVRSSDTDIPTETVAYESFDAMCNRYRKPLKLELRGMIGSRLAWHNDGLFYPGYGNQGGIYYDKNDFVDKVMGFGPGGTNLIVGAEAAVLPRIAVVNNRHSFNLGLLTGYWPVDGAHWLPLSLHPRFTFNEISSPLWGKCNAWYVYGDLGPVLKMGNIGSNTAFPSIGNQLGDWFNSPWGNLNYASWFTGIGVGFDFWKSRGRDLSVDFGYRYTNLKLPKNEDFEQCMIDAGLEVDLPFPARKSGQLFVRVGFTW